ncbi:porphobilinogen synthase [Candidatus Rariloculus sp.]|uniref:porphobilinogen synthase n=1 Tax=Candidatus Rariloculus sp. TaxID=3101265 RepID=UPI003D0DFEAD
MSELSITTPERIRPRRLRRTRALRDLVAETGVAAEQLVMPHFVLPKPEADVPIASMPGISQLGIETLLGRVESDLALGIRSVLLFGHPQDGGKTPDGAAAAAANGAVQSAVRRLKQTFGDSLLVMTDVCLCAYTDHGHCGVLRDGEVANDPSLGPLVNAALSHAQAGADVVAPSDMMDGRVAAIRDALDSEGHDDVVLLSYAVKYASAYYGPFRDAADSTPGMGDRKSYQMDCRNVREAIREAELDAEEGADLLMVKPALPYLDVIRAVREATRLPLAAYNVSGEYSSVKAAAANGWLDEPSIVRENLLAIKRAGADLIITYHARDALAGGWL